MTRFPIPGFSLRTLSELRNRLFFVIIALIVYRIGSHIPIPGLDPERIAFLFKQQDSGLMAYFNMLSGGAEYTIFGLGLQPYITMSIFVQLLSMMVPSLEKLQKEGEFGRRKLNQYTRYGVVVLAPISGFVKVKQILIPSGIVLNPDISFYAITILTLVAGSMFLMWLGEQITAHGIGNGASLIIFAGIVAGLPRSVVQFIEQVRQGQVAIIVALLICAVVIGVTSFVIWMERAQRKITVHYPQRQQGRHMYAAQSSHLPLKINMAGIMPTIFASSIIMTIGVILGWLGILEKYPALQPISLLFMPGQPLYILTIAVAITFFYFFYTALIANPRDVADNLKKTGAFIPGIRPGEQTAQYIDMVMTRLAVIGCLYLLWVVLLPEIMVLFWKVPITFGGTALLIVVGVVMEFISHTQSLLVSHQYERFIKKSAIKR
jgi:preprotein translocase subunit SecY